MPSQWSEAKQVPLGCIAPPRPQARNSPPSAREVSWPSAMTEGETLQGRTLIGVP